MKFNNLAETKEAALRLLARREYGADELKQKLLARGSEIETTNQVMQLLHDLNLQSDVRFVECYVSTRAAKGFGPAYIMNELSKIKIDESLIQEKLHGYHEQWQTIISRVCSRKFRTTHYFTDLNMKAKQIRFLQSRGFYLSQINEALSPCSHENG